MEDILLILSIQAIHLFAWLTPGPLLVLILRNSLLYSRRIGMWTAVGFAVGNIIHISFAILITLLVINTAESLFLIMKYVGISYILYLGVKTITAKVQIDVVNSVSSEKVDEISPYEAFSTGLLMNIFSPKALIFFTSIIAAVMSTQVTMLPVVVVTILMPLNSLVMATLWSVFFTQPWVRERYGDHQRKVNILLGLLLISLAAIALFY